LGFFPGSFFYPVGWEPFILFLTVFPFPTQDSAANSIGLKRHPERLGFWSIFPHQQPSIHFNPFVSSSKAGGPNLSLGIFVKVLSALTPF